MDTVLTLFQGELSSVQASTTHTADTVYHQACSGTVTAEAHEPIHSTLTARAFIVVVFVQFGKGSTI